MQPGGDRERGGGKEKEREIRLTFVRSFGRKGERGKDDRKGDGVADSAQKGPEFLDSLELSKPIVG